MFQTYAHYYDLLYQEKPYHDEVAYVISQIHRYHPRAKTILDLGCGTGKHALGFAQHGYSVYGVDMSAEMIEYAQQLKQHHKEVGNQLTFKQGDARSLQLFQTYDVVVSLFHVLSYQTSYDDVCNFFATIKRHLNPGGLVILDCWYGPAILHQGVEVRVKRVTDNYTTLMRLTEPVLYSDRNVVAIDFTLMINHKGQATIIQERHEMRYFFKPELEVLFSQIGIDLLGCETLVSRQSPSVTTRDVCLIGRMS